MNNPNKIQTCEKCIALQNELFELKKLNKRANDLYAKRIVYQNNYVNSDKGKLVRKKVNARAAAKRRAIKLAKKEDENKLNTTITDITT